MASRTPVAPTPDAERRVDPILFEVIRNALVEVTEEMSVSLQRTAFSTNVKTRLDYSCAFVDAAGRMVAQAFCQPAHLVTIGRLVPRAVAEHGPENLAPGDMLVVNDPHRQASHLNDIFLIAPFYYEERLVGHLANICHHVDVGGGAPASIGAFRETYQEGIILPVVKLVARGEIDAGLWKMILANVSAKREVAGDLRAQISANRMGLRRLGALLDRYGEETLGFYIQHLLDYTEKRTRAEIEKLPRGTFEAQGFLHYSKAGIRACSELGVSTQVIPSSDRIDARKCPLHLLTGEYDFACTPDDSHRTAAAIDGVEVTVMDGLGHYPMSEQVPPLPPAGGGRARLTPGGDRGHS